MSEEPKKYSIKELFSSDKYVIPIYQRNYEWGESQISQLIQDIVDYMKKDNTKNYYIGTLIVYERKLEGIYETIDGQQRLTTLTILLNVIKKEYPEMENRLSWYKNLNLSFDSRKIASNTLSYLFNNEELGNKECNTAIKQGYECAKKSLVRILNDKDNNLTINDFCDYFFGKVTILRVLVPEDTNLNHYFEIMNSRGEQLEKHEILKAQMLEILKDDNLKYAFNMIWEAASNMEKYVQYGFSVEQRNKIFGDDWDKLVDKDELYKILQNSTAEQITEAALTISQLLEESAKQVECKSDATDESPERFNTIINFSNFLLHILRIQTKSDKISLDDKRLLELFDPFLKEDGQDKNKNKEFVKQFAYNLLKGKFFFDKYIIKREFAKGTDHWSLKRIKRYDGNNVNYVNTFDADENAETNDGINKEILMLLSMFHVSNPTLVYKYWLYASLRFVLEKGTVTAGEYKTYFEQLAKAFLNDRFLAKTPKKYFEIIDTNNGVPKNTVGDIDEEKLNQGTAVENFIFNYLDYLLWQNYKKKKEHFTAIFKGNVESKIDDPRIKDFEYTFRSSVEHYYPQNPIDNNMKLQGSDDQWLDNFGNLCLISSSKNSRLSNYMPAAKKEHYRNSPTIDSIKQRIMMEYDNWDTSGPNGKNEIK
jgi:uncharacterized protein with ParB-like and HNH nuclease domain